MRALVVGGAGFIGRPICRLLLQQGWTVCVADSLVIRPEESLPQGVECWTCDVRWHSQLASAVQWARPDVIFWLAARQGYAMDWRQFASTNVMPAYSLAEVLRDEPAGRAVKRIVLASSQAIYAPGLNANEESEKVPTSVYGQSKLQQERAFRFFAEFNGPPVVALRPCVVLGRGQAVQSSESGVLRNWARSALAGAEPEIYGTGEHVRDFVHVEDVARAFVLAAQPAVVQVAQPALGEAQPPFLALNLGGHPESLLGLAKRFHEAWGCGPAPVVLGRDVRPGGEFSMTSSSERVAAALGWRPELSLDRQVMDFVAGVKAR